jgi:FAD/FMN-containing dehydrogenase
VIDRRPRAIVRAQDEADVLAAIRAAGDAGVPLAVRGGGHGVPGYGTCDDGVVLDLGGLRNVNVDPAKRIARVGGGALLGDLDHATHAFGMATPAGFISTTGVGGLRLGGGLGYLSRRLGLTCDNLLSARVATADGRLVEANAEENADLFWAVRGGGGNFGVATSFEFRLHPVDQVVGGPIFFELDAPADVLDFFQSHFRAAPRELGGFFGFQIAPPLPFIPEERHGDTLCLLVVCWSGDVARGDEVLKPIRAAGPVVAEGLGAMPYPVLQGAFDALLPAGLRHYWKADYVRDVPEAAIAAHVEHGPRVPTMMSTMHIYLSDGAVQDVAADATAYARRDADFVSNIVGVWDNPADDEKNTAWVRENYGGSYDRLTEVKRRWDPGNLFRLNQNVTPTRESAATS